jgi:Fe-S-cluster-containing dehydrogenase component
MIDERASKTLIFDAEQCTGCMLCELACSMAKGGEYNPGKSFIQILKNWELDVNIATLDLRCDFCEECVPWCPTNAITFVDIEQAAVLRKQEKIGVFPAPFRGSS